MAGSSCESRKMNLDLDLFLKAQKMRGFLVFFSEKRFLNVDLYISGENSKKFSKEILNFLFWTCSQNCQFVSKSSELYFFFLLDLDLLVFFSSFFVCLFVLVFLVLLFLLFYLFIFFFLFIFFISRMRILSDNSQFVETNLLLFSWRHSDATSKFSTRKRRRSCEADFLGVSFFPGSNFESFCT